ncbi:hypothetical protein CORC01_11845, partial [Colletotrichum orchidophilum]
CCKVRRWHLLCYPGSSLVSAGAIDQAITFPVTRWQDCRPVTSDRVSARGRRNSLPSLSQSHIEQVSGLCLCLLPQAVTRPTGFLLYLAIRKQYRMHIQVDDLQSSSPCRTSTVAGASHLACLPPSRFPAMPRLYNYGNLLFTLLYLSYLIHYVVMLKTWAHPTRQYCTQPRPPACSSMVQSSAREAKTNHSGPPPKQKFLVFAGVSSVLALANATRPFPTQGRRQRPADAAPPPPDLTTCGDEARPSARNLIWSITLTLGTLRVRFP